MAEADILAFVITGIVGFCFAVLLDVLRQRRIRPKKKKSPNYHIPHYSPTEKKQFLKSIPLGICLGIFVYLPHLNAIVGGESLWFLPFLQVYPVIIYTSLIVTFAVFKFMAAFTNVNFFIDRQGYADGILSSFVIVQVIVFIFYPMIVFPKLGS